MKPSDEPEPPRLSDEGRWYTEHTALVVTTLKWAVLGTVAGASVGWGTRAFLWSLAASSELVHRLFWGWFRPTFLLPLALVLCVWLIRTFAPTAKGHGTEAVIAAIHTRSGKVDWRVAPIKLLATVLTLAFGGSVGKEGPYGVAAAGGAALALFYRAAGEQYAGLGIPTIEASLAGAAKVVALAFLFKILATALTLETGGSGGIVTPLFFIGATRRP